MAYSSITKPEDYFNTKLWTGNSDTTRNITGVGFQPDWSWVKNRSLASDHRVADAVRGANKGLVPNGNDAEDSSTTAVKSFLSDGIQIGNEQSFNRNGDNHVGWFWKANGAGSSNTDGTITSTVSANQTAGFSIVKYTGNATAGATVGHGLGAAPKMILFKNLDSTSSSAEHWLVYHESVGNTHGTFLNTTSAEDDDITYFNDTSPTSSVFSLGSGDKTNKSGEGQIAYCFAEKKGYSKFGTYRGNGNANGPFVYTGFKPAFVMIKQFNTTGNWALSDNKRKQNSGNQDGGNSNFVPHMLAANLNNNEAHFGGGSSNKQDYLSNGFKIRDTGGYANTSAGSYLYMAFAENPLVANVSGGIPATAR